jgi:hypothetical protein
LIPYLLAYRKFVNLEIMAGTTSSQVEISAPRSEVSSEIMKKDGTTVSAESASTSDQEVNDSSPGQIPVPLKWKLASILMVSAIGFGSNWSSGITGAMKSTIKKEMNINNTEYALLDASQDFMVTALMLVSGVVTDRIGGAGKL